MCNNEKSNNNIVSLLSILMWYREMSKLFEIKCYLRNSMNIISHIALEQTSYDYTQKCVIDRIRMDWKDMVWRNKGIITGYTVFTLQYDTI